MPIEPGNYTSPYTVGEAKALIAPMLECEPSELGEFIIIARSSDHQKIGVFRSFHCNITLHGDCKAIDLIGEFLQDQAERMYQETPQHGPKEG